MTQELIVDNPFPELKYEILSDDKLKFNEYVLVSSKDYPFSQPHIYLNDERVDFAIMD